MAAQVSFIATLFNLLQDTGGLSFDQGNILWMYTLDDVNTFFSTLVKIRILLHEVFLQELRKYKVFTTERRFLFLSWMSSISESLQEQRRCSRKGSYTIFPLSLSWSFSDTPFISFWVFFRRGIVVTGIIKCFRKNIWTQKATFQLKRRQLVHRNYATKNASTLILMIPSFWET